MLQLSQIFKEIDLELIVLMFNICYIILLVYQNIYFFYRDRITIYLRVPKLKKILEITTKVSAGIFFIIFLFWQLLLLSPKISDWVSPADSTQKIILKNNTDKQATYVFVGRLAYQDVWKPIRLDVSSKSLIENLAEPAKITLNKNETAELKIRTGLKDIIYLYIGMLENNKNKFFFDQTSSLLVKVPVNDLVLYPSSFTKMQFSHNNKKNNQKINICFIEFYISIIFYFTGVISCIWIFTKIQNISKISKIILIVFLFAISVTLCCLIFLNIKMILFFT